MKSDGGVILRWLSFQRFHHLPKETVAVGTKKARRKMHFWETFSTSPLTGVKSLSIEAWALSGKVLKALEASEKVMINSVNSALYR